MPLLPAAAYPSPSRGGRPGLRMACALSGIRPACGRAWRSRYSICAFVLRSSSAAQRASASWTAGSSRSSSCLRLLITESPSVQTAGVHHGAGGLLRAEDDEQVAHHRSFAFLVKFDDAVFGEAFEGVVDHADGSFHDLGAGGNYGARLLALQHRLGYFAGVSEVGDAALDDVYAGGFDAGGDLFGQFLGDLFSVVAQGQSGRAEVVVRVVVGGVPDGCFRLDGDEIDVVVHFESGAGRVFHLPDDDRRNLDRIAVGIVHFQDGRFVVADAAGNFCSGRERVHPSHAGRVDRAAVVAEQLHHARFVRGDYRDAGQAERTDDRDDESQAELPAAGYST